MMKTLQRCGVLVLTLALLIGILPVDTILYAKAQPTKKETDVSNKKTSGQMTTLKYPMHQLQKMTQHRGQVMRKTSALDKHGNLIYPVENGNIYFNKTKNTIVKADQTITSAIIPSNIEGIPVKAIGNEAFRDCSKLKTVSLPKGLEGIGNKAFSYCTSLEKIFIPKTVVRTGKYYGQPGAWFWGCEKLKEIILEEGTSRIIEGSFSGIPNSFKMVIPASVKEIGSQAFANSKGIKKVTYGEPTTVGTIVIPQTVKSIGESAFYDCSELENVKWPSHIKNIPNEAFRDCFKLKTISLPKDLEEIGYRAFSHCTSLEKIFIPKTVVRTGKYYGQPGAWFWGCEKLKEIILEEGTSRIIEGSFSGIPNSFKMVIPASVKEIGSQAFANSKGIKKVTYGEPTTVGTIVIPQTVKSIGESAFYDCSELENVKWPSHIKNIPNEAFRDCFKLKTISLPKDLEEIGYRAFSHCTSLEKIFIPKTVVRTGKYYGQPGAWFWGCEKLKEIILEEGTSRIIEGSFSGISSSYKMVIPESVKEIGERAFANSENLKTLTLNKNITLIADNSFENCSSLELEFPLNYVCLEHVFKKNIPYKLIIGEHKMNAGILNEKSSRFKVDGITPEGYYNCSIQYEVDSNKFAALKNKMIRMRLDNNTRMVYSSIKMNGQKLTNISMIDHLLSIPVTENHGTISFLLKPFNGIQAKAFASFSYSDSDKKMDDLIGYISSSEAGITCETPSFTSEKTFEIQGYSKADAVVKIFIDEKLQGEVKTDHKGFYKYSLHHNFNTFGSHTIKVNLNETNKWVLKKVVFDPNHPELEKFEMIYSNHHLEAGNDYHSVDLLKNDISYVTAWYNRPLTFKIKYKNDKNIGAVFLNGYIEGKKAMIQMFKDKKTGEWVNKYPFVPSDPLKLPSSIWPTVIRKDQLKTENDDKIDLDLKKNEKLDKSVARMSKNYFSETLKIKKDDIKPGFSRKIDKNKTSSSLLALAQTYDKLISSSEVEYDSILAEYKHSLASYIKSSVSKFKKMNGITIEKNPNIEVVSNIAMNMLSIGLGELNADLGFVFDTITNTIDVYTCYYYMFRVLAAIENNNKADLKKYGNLLIRKSLVASFNIYSLFNPTQGLANAITMGLFSFALEKILDGIDFATGIEFLVNLPKIIRDPSGYVYEAVTSNRIEGAVVSIYHQDLVNGTPVFWESAKFGQENNQITKADGKYGWNVPEGNWQVRCQKPGYENYTSGWIKVPPQHDDINIGLISKETPTLSNGIRKDDGIELNFSKYMKPDSVKNMVINDEKGEVFAKKYILKIKNKGKVAYSLKTNGKIKSYAGISMDEKTMVLK